MKIEFLQTPIVIDKNYEHDSLKLLLLDAISNEGKMVNDTDINPGYGSYLEHTKTDYITGSDKIPYQQLLEHPLHKFLVRVCEKFGYNRYELHNIWYQQYYLNSTHTWHTHTGCQFTGVYYLEMPRAAPKTELRLLNQNCDNFVLDVQEGDIAIFPSCFVHRAPKVVEDIRKTIISFNMSFAV